MTHAMLATFTHDTKWLLIWLSLGMCAGAIVMLWLLYREGDK